MRRRSVLAGMAGVLAGCAAPGDPRRRHDPEPGGDAPVDPRQAYPNILYIYLDQLRAPALSLFGESNIQTPNLDALLSSGASFTRHYASTPLCSPARATLLTGRYSHHHGVWTNGVRLPHDSWTLSRSLAGAGYTTGYIGKWHLDGFETDFVPPERRHGFQAWAAKEFGHQYRNAVYYRNEDEALRWDPPDTFEPRFQNELAFEFMDAASQSRAPWFLMMGYGPPHPPDSTTPDRAWEEHIPRRFFDAVDPDALVLRPNVPLGSGEGELRAYLRGYYAAILAMDDVVGQLLHGLRSRGLASDTLVVFTSDHGEQGGSHGLLEKGLPWEEGTHVPLGFRWPSMIPENRSIDHLATQCDIVPTILGLAGLGQPPQADGLDLSDQVFGFTDHAPRDVIFGEGGLGEAGAWVSARDDRYKLVWMPFENDGEGVRQLWDLREDPFELEDQADALPSVVRDLEEAVVDGWA